MKKTMPDRPPSALRCSGTKPLPPTCCGLTAGRSRGLNLNVGLSQQWPIRLPKGCPKICFCLHFSARLCILLLVLTYYPSTKYASVERLSLYRSRRFESPWGRQRILAESLVSLYAPRGDPMKGNERNPDALQCDQGMAVGWVT